MFDVSSIPEDETELVGAALSACWGVGFGAVNVTHALAEAGLAPMRHYLIILDELWRALIAGRGMVDRTNSLTRLNRQWGVGVVMCSHTIKDLLSLPDEHERMKALGLIERSGMLICGALPPEEMPRLALAKDLSVAEQRQLISWQDPPAWSAAASNDAPPGRGNFMIKIGGRPGIPFRVTLTKAEERLHDTNKLWHEQSRRGELLTAGHTLGATAAPEPMRQADRHATGPSTLSPLLDGHARAAGARRRRRRSRRAGGRGDRPLAPPPAARSARARARARRRPHPLAAGRDADPDRGRGGVRSGRWLRRGAARPQSGRPARIARRGCWAPAAACIRCRSRTRRATAKRFGVEQPGLPIARAVAGGQALYATWEDMQCDIWGPRKGKSSSRAIPTLLAAPGAAFAT